MASRSVYAQRLDEHSVDAGSPNTRVRLGTVRYLLGQSEWPASRYCFRPVFVSDLRHFLDMPDDAPGPARKMAEHLGSIVKAATASKAVTTWETALPCRRRPGNRRCPGHIVVFRPDLPASIDWRCSACDDEGWISGWEGSYFDLRRPRARRADFSASEIPVTDEVCATLRDLRLLDSDCERLVFGARASTTGIVLVASEEDLDELIGYVAAEANHETNRRRQKRLDLAFAAFSEALEAMGC